MRINWLSFPKSDEILFFIIDGYSYRYELDFCWSKLNLYVQNSLKLFLCHRITVSGFTTIIVSRQPFQKRERKTQKIRSLLRILGRLTDCFMMDSCWRNTRFSIMRFLFNLNIKIVIKIVKMIVSIMPEGITRWTQNCQWFQERRINANDRLFFCCFYLTSGDYSVCQ